MNLSTSKKVQYALRSYGKGYSETNPESYLYKMDKLAVNYNGSKSEKVSALIHDYLDFTGIQTFKEAVDMAQKKD
jgi:hypothetical protein